MMLRAGTAIAGMPRCAARRAWTSSPSSPKEATVPAAPPSSAWKTRGSACLRRSTWRANSSIQIATFRPQVAGTACWPWVRPGSAISAERSARSASAAKIRLNWPR